MYLDRVILIDDNRVDNLINQRMLEACELSSNIVVFDNPIIAYEWFCGEEGSKPESAHNSIVLLDINMPGLNGFELLHKLVNEHPTGFPDYKVLMLTSSKDIQDQIRASNNPLVLGYFHKPLTPSKITSSLVPLLGSLFGKAS